MSYDSKDYTTRKYREVFIINDEQYKFRIFAEEVTRNHWIEAFDDGYYEVGTDYYEVLSNKKLNKNLSSIPEDREKFMSLKKRGKFDYLKSDEWSDFIFVTTLKVIFASKDEVSEKVNAEYYQKVYQQPEENGQIKLLINGIDDVSEKYILEYYQELEKKGQMKEYVLYIKSLASKKKSQLIEKYNRLNNEFEMQIKNEQEAANQAMQENEAIKRKLMRMSNNYKF